MAQPYFDELSEIASTHLMQNDHLQCKHFFSGAALYCDGNICASLSPKGLAFKLDSARAEQLIAQGKAEELRYFEKSPVKKGYILLSEYGKARKSEIGKYLEECISKTGRVAT